MMQPETDDIDPALARIAAAVDPDSPVNVSVQLRGALEYGIATGDIPPNTRLPSVRRLAASLKLSPVTVSGVYAALQDRGHVEGRVGSGTFVADRAPPPAFQTQRLAAFERQIDTLIETGRQLGLSRQDIAFRLAMATPRPATPLRILVLGTFLGATKAYAADLQAQIGNADTVIAASMQDVEAGNAPPADLVFCPHTLTAKATRLFPDIPVLGMTLIPNEATRIALAGIPPEANVVAVSYFDDFLPTLKSGIDRFAPHLGRVSAVPRGFDGLADLVMRSDVLIYATGAEYLAATLRADQSAIEYRHTPDSHALRSEILPAIEAARANHSPKDPSDEDK